MKTILTSFLTFIALFSLAGARLPEVSLSLTKITSVDVTKDLIRVKATGEVHIVFLYVKDASIKKGNESFTPTPSVLSMKDGEILINKSLLPDPDKVILYFKNLIGKDETAMVGIHGEHEIGIAYGLVNKVEVKKVLELKYPWVTKNKLKKLDEKSQ